MTTFGDAQAELSIEPLRRVTLPPSAFKEGPESPKEPIVVGLRLLSEGDILALRKAAYTEASKAFPALSPGDALWDEHYNHALMLGASVEALCNRDDRTKPWHTQQRTLLPAMLSRGGVERIWDELEEFTVQTSPTAPEASPTDLARLAAILGDPTTFEHLAAGDARGVRRMLRHVLDRLTANG